MERTCSIRQLEVTQAWHARSATIVDESCPSCWSSGFSSKRQAPVASEPLPEICSPTPDGERGILSEDPEDFKESRGAGAGSRGVQRQPAGKEDSKTIHEKRAIAYPKSARVVSGRRPHELRMLVDHQMSRDGISEESLLERRAVKSLAARRNSQTALGSLHCLWSQTTNSRAAFSKDCLLQGVQHHHVSQLLAAVMDRWPSPSRCGSSKLPRFHRSLKGWRQLTPARTRRVMSAPVLEGIAAPFQRPACVHWSFWHQKERSGPTVDATSPLLAGRDHSIRN